jgi:hypothetical protein
MRPLLAEFSREVQPTTPSPDATSHPVKRKFVGVLVRFVNLTHQETLLLCLVGSQPKLQSLLHRSLCRL